MDWNALGTLFCSAVIIEVASDGRVVDDELERIWKEIVWPEIASVF
jgi:hypothetical protein